MVLIKVYCFSFNLKEQLLVTLNNVNEVNREPAHSEWCLVHVTFDQTDLSCNSTVL